MKSRIRINITVKSRICIKVKIQELWRLEMEPWGAVNLKKEA
jgi:hypothetical protein